MAYQSGTDFRTLEKRGIVEAEWDDPVDQCGDKFCLQVIV